jgi:hypothetical protein
MSAARATTTLFIGGSGKVTVTGKKIECPAGGLVVVGTGNATRITAVGADGVGGGTFLGQATASLPTTTTHRGDVVSFARGGYALVDGVAYTPSRCGDPPATTPARRAAVKAHEVAHTVAAIVAGGSVAVTVCGPLTALASIEAGGSAKLVLVPGDGPAPRKLCVQASGASHVDLGGVAAAEGNLVASGSATICNVRPGVFVATASGAASVDAVGATHLRRRANPRFDGELYRGGYEK